MSCDNLKNVRLVNDVPSTFNFQCFCCDKKLSDIQIGFIKKFDDSSCHYSFSTGVMGGIPINSRGAYGSKIIDGDIEIKFFICDACLMKNSKKVLSKKLSQNSVHYSTYDKVLIKNYGSSNENLSLVLFDSMVENLDLPKTRQKYVVNLSDYYMNGEPPDAESFITNVLLPMYNIAKTTNGYIYLSIKQQLSIEYSDKLICGFFEATASKQIEKFVLIDWHDTEDYGATWKALCIVAGHDKSTFYMEDFGELLGLSWSRRDPEDSRESEDFNQ